MFEKIKNWLSSEGIIFEEVHHEPTKTSEESARVRGVDLSIGGKALVLKTDNSFGLFIFSAARKLDSGAVRRHFGVKKVRFADRDELMELTGLVPGSVPPFGKPLINLDLYVDNSIVKSDQIAFNAGSLTDSIIMSVEDYLKVANAEIFEFSKEG